MSLREILVLETSGRVSLGWKERPARGGTAPRLRVHHHSYKCATGK